MPEQAEWTESASSGTPNAHSDSGDYTWKPEYIRRAVAPLQHPQFGWYGGAHVNDGERVEELERKVKHLEAIVHRYINASEGER